MALAIHYYYETRKYFSEKELADIKLLLEKE